ncbi:hypothetical protein [Clostridium sp. VAP52]|uniref:hypothetical protein n=1 Tax=Clostridium sp. VAP52 TaxID=2949977 RepID=UPI0020792A7F|nr:hypothetical protein [Clostridium sp. VAP52]
MKHEDLKSGDIVIFKRYSNTLEEETFQDGYVIGVYTERKEVSICWLEGYKSRSDLIKYENVVAKYDKNGEHMKFGIYSGNSVLLDS